MKSYAKKILSLFLVLTLLLIPSTAVSGDGTIQYTQSPCTLTKYQTDEQGKIILPEAFGNEPLERIGMYAFSGSNNISEVVIPKTVNSVLAAAFYGCSSLKKVNIPSGVETVSKFTFWDCSSLSDIILPDSVLSIDDGAFWSCKSLESLSFPNGLKTIGDAAFYNSGIRTAVIPDSTTYIGESAFDSCRDLKLVAINGAVAEIKKETFNSCSSLESVLISEGTVSIADGAFSGCSSLSAVTIPKSVQTISSSAFKDCGSLKRIIGYKGSFAENFAAQNGLEFYDAENEHKKLSKNYMAARDSNGQTIIIGSCFECGGIIEHTVTGFLPSGDADGNGTVDLDDAIFAAQYSVGLIPIAPDTFFDANVNSDEKLNIIDALIIARSAQKTDTEIDKI